MCIMSNFVNDAIFGTYKCSTCDGSVGENFFDELTKSPIIKVILFIGSVAVAGYFTIMFFKEASVILPRFRSD